MKEAEDLLVNELNFMKHKEQLLQKELDALKEITKECPPARLPSINQECQTLLLPLSSKVANEKETRSMADLFKLSSPLRDSKE